MFESLRNVDRRTVRNLIAFWIFGMCNNFAYVIMLSAAEDIIDKQQHVTHQNDTDADACEEHLTERHCSMMSTGYILLADIIPSLIIKATFPFFMQRIPYGLRHFLVVLIQAGSYLLVAFSQDLAMSITGVAFASMCSGLGEITLLSLTSYFPKSTISAWSSGTGGAGVVGSFAYAALTDPKLGHLTPTNALLVMLVVPVTFALAYWILLAMPDTVYSPGISPLTWIVPVNHDKKTTDAIDIGDGYGTSWAVDDIKTERSSEDDCSSDDLPADSNEALDAPESNSEKVSQRHLSIKEKLLHVIPLLKYMIPLALVYFGEYIINQGIVQLVFFNCSQGFGISRKSQYRWYQVLYQVGVFISRSSVSLIELPMWILILLPVLQILNAVFFFFDALYMFVPHISILFALILIEGLFGGASYVNSFNRIHREVAPDVREYSLSAASMSDSFGIVFSGFLAIPIHNFICGQALPSNARRQWLSR